MSTITISFDIEAVQDEVAVATEIVDLDGVVRWHGVAMLASATDAENLESDRTYLVRAHFPSGFEATIEVHVDDAATVVQAVLPAPSPSPLVPEDAAWAFYLQDGDARAQTGPTLEYDEVRAWSRAITEPDAPDDWSDLRIPLEAGIHHRRWEVRFASPTPIGGIYASLRFLDDRESLTQTWLSVGSRSFAIPHHPQATDIAIVAERGRVAVRTRNPLPDSDALLSYMQYGDVVSARIVGNRLIDLLSTLHPDQRLKLLPTLNPAAALIAGYYAIRGMPIERLTRQALIALDKSLDDVRSYSPAFPDGGVICGSSVLRLNLPQSASKEFLWACKRGLPFYTLGVRSLFDGLRAIPDPYPEVAEAIAWLMPYADKVDWTARTTALQAASERPPFSTFHAKTRISEPSDFLFAHRHEALRAQPDVPPSELWQVTVLARLQPFLAARRDDPRVSAALLAVIDELGHDPIRFPRVGAGLQIIRVEGGDVRGDDGYAVKFLADEARHVVTLVQFLRWGDAPPEVRGRYDEDVILFDP
jgi:hypothetical protein